MWREILQLHGSETVIGTDGSLLFRACYVTAGVQGCYMMVENQETALCRNEITVSQTYDACVSTSHFRFEEKKRGIMQGLWCDCLRVFAPAVRRRKVHVT